jgi:hypothetical protein
LEAWDKSNKSIGVSWMPSHYPRSNKSAEFVVDRIRVGQRKQRIYLRCMALRGMQRSDSQHQRHMDGCSPRSKIRSKVLRQVCREGVVPRCYRQGGDTRQDIFTQLLPAILVAEIINASLKRAQLSKEQFIVALACQRKCPDGPVNG